MPLYVVRRRSVCYSYGVLHDRADAIAAVEHTLEKMRMGGVYDQVGLGFHR